MNLRRQRSSERAGQLVRCKPQLCQPFALLQLVLLHLTVRVHVAPDLVHQSLVLALTFVLDLLCTSRHLRPRELLSVVCDGLSTAEEIGVDVVLELVQVCRAFAGLHVRPDEPVAVQDVFLAPAAEQGR